MHKELKDFYLSFLMRAYYERQKGKQFREPSLPTPERLSVLFV